MKTEEWFVGSDSKILLKTTDVNEIDTFTDKLCDKYEKEHDGSHEVYKKIGDRYFYSHATWFSRSGEVASRGVSPCPDQTNHFLEKYKEVKE